MDPCKISEYFAAHYNTKAVATLKYLIVCVKEVSEIISFIRVLQRSQHFSPNSK